MHMDQEAMAHNHWCRYEDTNNHEILIMGHIIQSASKSEGNLIPAL